MSKKKPNLNRARNMDIDAWRERQIGKRTKQRIAQDSLAFEKLHENDTDQALREYVLSKANLLGRMPHPLELSGGIYLVRRLGDWRELALSLGVIPASPRQGKRAYQRLRHEEAELFAAQRRAARTPQAKKAKKEQRQS